MRANYSTKQCGSIHCYRSTYELSGGLADPSMAGTEPLPSWKYLRIRSLQYELPSPFLLWWLLYNGGLSNEECPLLKSAQQLPVPIRTKSLATRPDRKSTRLNSSHRCIS